MSIVQKNPYRVIGILAGTSLKDQTKQINRLKKYLDAEQEPEGDFSFPVLGELGRTVDDVDDAASKLTLDKDKLEAALFWFWNGNPITDEPAFEALKEKDLDQVLSIWTKLTSSGEVSQKSVSAFNNLGTLLLSGKVIGANFNEALLEQAINLKLKFLESIYVEDFVRLVSSEIYKTDIKELQLIFLSQIQNELGKSITLTIKKFVEILSKINFSAKDEFIKGIAQKPIESVEKLINDAKSNCKSNKANAINVGYELFEQTKENLILLKSILGSSNLKYNSIVDKVADQILQCSIDYVNYCQEVEDNNSFIDKARELSQKAESIAVGKLVKDRIKDTQETLEEMKDREIDNAITFLQSIKDAYEKNKAKIENEVRSMRLGFNQTIDWAKVNELIENSLDWNKIVTIIIEVIPQRNIEKIKNHNNQSKINNYKNLVIFLMKKLNYSQKNKIRYICFWDDSGITLPTIGDFQKIPTWLKWVLGISIYLIVVALSNNCGR